MLICDHCPGHCNIPSYLTTTSVRLRLTVRKRFSLEITPGGGDGGDRPRWWETVYNFSSRSQPRRWHLQPRWWQFFSKMMTWWHMIIPNYDMSKYIGVITLSRLLCPKSIRHLNLNCPQKKEMSLWYNYFNLEKVDSYYNKTLPRSILGFRSYVSCCWGS